MRSSAAVVLAFAMIGCNRPPEPPAVAPSELPLSEQADKPAPTQRFTGTLRGNILAAGAETTGWALETDDGKRIDVDVSKSEDLAAEHDGKRVTIEGTSTTVNWPERGPRQLLRASRIVPADAAE